MNSLRLLRLEAKNFLVEWTALFGLLSILTAGAYGLFYGKNVIDGQCRSIAEAPRLQAEHTRENVRTHGQSGLGNVLYFNTFYTVHAPSPWSAFSLGQRDVYPYNLKIRMLAVEGQLYDTDLANPMTLLFGNFDSAFVFIFLFPLLIIALTYNLLSAEQESGVWTMVRAQPVSAMRVLLLKFSVRLVVVLLAALGLLMGGCLYVRVPFDGRIGAVAGVVGLYLLFWFGVAAVVIALGRSSSFNAVALLGIWILLAVLAPTALNVLLTNALPVPEALANTIQQREGYHQKWDRPKEETMQKFYRKYPELRVYTVPSDKFSWGWYYAMQEMGDEESVLTSGRLVQKLAERQRWTERVAAVLPTVNALDQLNKLAGTDLGSHLGYLQSVRRYHEQIRRHFYPAIFRETPPEGVNWRAVPVARYYQGGQRGLATGPVLGMGLFTVLLWALAGWQFRTRLT